MLGDIIRQRREALELSQFQLQAALYEAGLAVDQSLIARWERGKRPVSAAHLPTLVKVLQLSRAEMLEIDTEARTVPLSVVTDRHRQADVFRWIRRYGELTVVDDRGRPFVQLVPPRKQGTP